jgi:hypothetical protein
MADSDPRQSAKLPLHLWPGPTRIPGQQGPGHSQLGPWLDSPGGRLTRQCRLLIVFKSPSKSRVVRHKKRKILKNSRRARPAAGAGVFRVGIQGAGRSANEIVILLRGVLLWPPLLRDVCLQDFQRTVFTSRNYFEQHFGERFLFIWAACANNTPSPRRVIQKRNRL